MIAPQTLDHTQSGVTRSRHSVPVCLLLHRHNFHGATFSDTTHILTWHTATFAQIGHALKALGAFVPTCTAAQQVHSTYTITYWDILQGVSTICKDPPRRRSSWDIPRECTMV